MKEMIELSKVRAAVEYWLLPDDGRIRGYGGNYENNIKGDIWDHDTWSHGHDYQHAALDIWEMICQSRKA